MNLWRGEKIRLRQAEPEDYILYNNGDFDTETAKLYDKIEFPLCAQSIRENLKKEYSSDDFLFTIETVEGVPVGQLLVFDCDRRMGSFKFGQFIVSAHQGRGFASEAVRIVLEYYFNHLRYHKANVYIYDCNERSKKFHEKLGFVKEGVLRETAFFDGEYHDTVYYGLLDREFNK